MPGKIFLHLLILYGIWYQEILGTFTDEEIKESSDLLIREKRVVNYEQDGASVMRIDERKYIAHIKRSGRINCVGTILSHSVIITVADCIDAPATEYKVVSRTSNTGYIGELHDVTNIKLRNGEIHGRVWDGIALLRIHPPIEYGTYSRNIELHSGPLLPGMLGTVTGWGFDIGNHVSGPGTKYPRNLRSIQVPIISHRDCVDRYRHYYPITDKDICTFHPKRHCGHTDGGAPLVIDHLLVGIFLRSGRLGYRYNPEYPEIFALLQNTYYSNWIRANI